MNMKANEIYKIESHEFVMEYIFQFILNVFFIVVAGKSACSFYPTCVECRDDPACGWCDDGSGTGLGQCLPGGNAGPNQPNLSCVAGHWFFTECPSK
jgi:hypothetical protein